LDGTLELGFTSLITVLLEAADTLNEACFAAGLKRARKLRKVLQLFTASGCGLPCQVFEHVSNCSHTNTQCTSLLDGDPRQELLDLQVRTIEDVAMSVNREHSCA
jgi:hypothetical protein